MKSKNPLRGVVNFLRRVRDIGVPPEMRPEDSKYIQVSNLWQFFALLSVLPFVVLAIVNRHGLSLLFAVTGLFADLLVLVFNWRRQYTLARVYGSIIGCLFFMAACMLTGRSIHMHYGFFIVAAATILFFPKNQVRLMIVMLVLNALAYEATFYLQAGYGALLEWTPRQQELVNTAIDYTLGLAFITVVLISRAGAIHAERALKAEREKLAEAHEQVSRLSEKLKVYLPRQFVESIQSSGAEAGKSHRRKRLTVFFSDVQGFTRWTEKLEPEEVQEVLNKYLSEMSAIAHKHGGTIDKFIGDAIMIFFGDPQFTSDKDHALRAVRMAVEMQGKMAELRKEWENQGYQDPLHIRIGINTGYATVGNFGSEDRLNYTALGNAVNLASRLETACAPDKVMIAHTTYSLIRDEIKCVPKGEIEVKGFSEPVKIYEVISGQT